MGGVIPTAAAAFSMGLLREDGTPNLALHQFPEYTPVLGICQ